MRLSTWRAFFVATWLYGMVLFLQAILELIQKIDTVYDWERNWKLGLPVFFIFGITGLAAAAAMVWADSSQAGQKYLRQVSALRARFGNAAFVFGAFTIFLTAVLLIKNPWPWIFRWPHTRQFILLYAAALTTFILYPWLKSAAARAWYWLEPFQLQAQRVFLGLAVVFGLLYFFLIPPFMAADEWSHLDRSWAISELVFFHVKSTIPTSLSQFEEISDRIRFRPDQKVDLPQLLSFLQKPLQLNDRVVVGFPAANVYPAFIYFPQAAGIRLARVFQLSPFLVYYSGRLVNFLVWMLLAWAALRITPVYKWGFLVLLLLPMSFYQAVSLSPDALTNASAFFFAAVVLRCIADETPVMERKSLYLLFGASILLSLTKVPYFLLTLTVLLIPREKFGSRRQYFSYIAILMAGVAGTVLLANWYSIGLFTATRQMWGNPPFFQRVTEVLANPANFLNILIQTFRKDSGTLYQGFLGVLGWRDTPLTPLIYAAASCALLIAALTDGSKSLTFGWKSRAWVGVLVIGTVLTFVSLIYFSFTPAGGSTVYGVQGRYFLPVAPFAMLLFHNQRFSNFGKYTRWFLLAYLVWLFIAVAIIIANRFYAI